MSNYRITRYDPDLARQVVHLQKHMWGGSSSIRADYLDWKYHSNPYIEQPLIYVAMHDQQVVGMRGMFGSCWQAGTSLEKEIVPIASDTVIEPAHRVGGLFTDLNEFALADLRKLGYRCVLNLSASPQNYLASVLTLKWQSIGSYRMMIRDHAQRSGRSTLGRLANRIRVGGGTDVVKRKIRAALPHDPFADLDRRASNHSDRTDYPLRITTKADPPAMAGLVERIGGDGRIRHVRDLSYFNWRYGNPRSAFRYLYWGEERLEGYLILQNTSGQRHVRIADWEASDPQIGSLLLKTVVDLGRLRSLRVWSATLQRQACEQLAKLGFSPADEDPSFPRYSWRFLFKFLDDASDSSTMTLLGLPPLEVDSWDLRMIYSDAL